jgi:hypothetical protein
MLCPYGLYKGHTWKILLLSLKTLGCVCDVPVGLINMNGFLADNTFEGCSNLLHPTARCDTRRKSVVE